MEDAWRMHGGVGGAYQACACSAHACMHATHMHAPPQHQHHLRTCCVAQVRQQGRRGLRLPRAHQLAAPHKLRRPLVHHQVKEAHEVGLVCGVLHVAEGAPPVAAGPEYCVGGGGVAAAHGGQERWAVWFGLVGWLAMWGQQGVVYRSLLMACVKRMRMHTAVLGRSPQPDHHTHHLHVQLTGCHQVVLWCLRCPLLHQPRQHARVAGL